MFGRLVLNLHDRSEGAKVLCMYMAAAVVAVCGGCCCSWCCMWLRVLLLWCCMCMIGRLVLNLHDRSEGAKVLC
jgi:hypothetical protein